MEEMKWIFCPVCQSKTRIKIRRDTEIRSFPLYCPKCRQETLINVKEYHISVVNELELQVPG